MIPVHVREEAPRVPADRHHEGGRFDPGRALELWQSQYTAVLYVVDTAGVPMTPPAQILHSGLAPRPRPRTRLLLRPDPYPPRSRLTLNSVTCCCSHTGWGDRPRQAHIIQLPRAASQLIITYLVCVSLKPLENRTK